MIDIKVWIGFEVLDEELSKITRKKELEELCKNHSKQRLKQSMVVEFAEVNAQQVEKTVKPLETQGELIHLIASLFGIIWSFMVNVTETQGSNYFPIKATLAQVAVSVLSIVTFVISLTSLGVTFFKKDKDFWDALSGANASFEKEYLAYIAPIRANMYTVIFLSLFYALIFDGEVYDESSWVSALGFGALIASAIARLLQEVTHGEDLSKTRDLDVKFGDSVLGAGAAYEKKMGCIYQGYQL